MKDIVIIRFTNELIDGNGNNELIRDNIIDYCIEFFESLKRKAFIVDDLVCGSHPCEEGECD